MMQEHQQVSSVSTQLFEGTSTLYAYRDIDLKSQTDGDARRASFAVLLISQTLFVGVENKFIPGDDKFRTVQQSWHTALFGDIFEDLPPTVATATRSITRNTIDELGNALDCIYAAQTGIVDKLLYFPAHRSELRHIC